jgi:hypothetical protein
MDLSHICKIIGHSTFQKKGQFGHPDEINAKEISLGRQMNTDEPEKCLKCLKCAKMPKIMVSLQASPSATTRQVAPSLLSTSNIYSMKNKKSASGYNYKVCFFS